ncbi:hypothetical protein H0H92_014844 [Tricholoma furcatifolium]|nr:hypothetical protein H0H92_014844 [Tricholoma furcatifolium]
MDIPTSDFTCICRRSFASPGALKKHENSCKSRRDNFAAVLAHAQKANAARKAVPAPSEDPGLNSQEAMELKQSETGNISHRRSPETVVSDDARRPTKRQRRLPARYQDHVLNQPNLRDVLPEPLTPVQSLPTGEAPDLILQGQADKVVVDTEPVRHASIDTHPNAFQVFRHYEKLPDHDPESYVGPASLSDVRNFVLPQQSTSLYAPYPNRNAFKLGAWYWNDGIQKSSKSFQSLLKVVSQDDFRPEDVRGVNWSAINQQLGLNEWDSDQWGDVDATWSVSSVSIKVPFHRRLAMPGVRDFVVKSFYRRPLVAIIEEKLQKGGQNIRQFHIEPYTLLWNAHGSEEPIRLHGEIYTSSSFARAHEELQASPPEPGCELPRYVVALMFWSDGTHLTNFGDASLTPLYMQFGNESKYRRCKPTEHLTEHVAYFEELPDDFKTFASHYMGKTKVNSDFLTHCRREIAHAQWTLLLDEDFIQCYRHGLVATWDDGISRRFYPRILCYSADYKEKALMATIRMNGLLPCPRCMVAKADAHLVGQKRDRKNRVRLLRKDDSTHRSKITTARSKIYQENLAVDSAAVKRLLILTYEPQAYNTRQNAFSKQLREELGPTWFSMFVIDQMHEIELGVWKHLFIHLLRILESLEEPRIHELDRRFRMVPTFGADTIRKFGKKVSELKKMAARDYEDILQVAIPIFEGLLDGPHDSAISDLLFRFAYWHGLAKLRLHSDRTLEILDQQTTKIGNCLRNFKDTTCPAFQTRELKRESEARSRRQKSKFKSKSGPTRTTKYGGKAKGVVPHRSSPWTVLMRQGTAPDPQLKQFTLNGYKVHAMGDYVATIREYGTTDSYSTELVTPDPHAQALLSINGMVQGELEHRWPKGNYRRTSKKDYQKQLAQIERRQARLRRIQMADDAADYSGTGPMVSEISCTKGYNVDAKQSVSAVTGFGCTGKRERSLPDRYLSKTSTEYIFIHGEEFVTRLKGHLLPRIKIALAIPIVPAHPASQPETPLLQESVYIHNDTMYHHKIMRVNYTTYDMRRAQDSFNPGTSHRDVMLLSDLEQGGHQFRYARVVGIFHVNAMYAGPGWHQNYSTQALHVLWVRWLQLESDVPVDAPWNSIHPRLDCLSFKPIQDPDAFGFVDPASVLRGCHLIPRMGEGPSYPDGKGHSPCARDGEDWKYYYINRFVDRDMLMRYHWGLAAGHTYCRSTSSRHHPDPLEGDYGLSNTDCDEQDAVLQETSGQAQAQLLPNDPTDGDDTDDDIGNSGSDSPSESSLESTELDSDSAAGEMDDSASEGMGEVYGNLNDMVASFD